MSLDATRWAWLQRVGRSSAKLVLLSIADRASEDHMAYPSIARLSEDTEMDRKTVMSCIGYLIQKGIIEASKRQGARTTYRLIGVQDRHDTSTKNGTSTKFGTSPKNGTAPVPNLGPQPVPNLGHEPTNNQSITNHSSSARGSRLHLEHLPSDWMTFCKTKRPDLDPVDTWEQFRDYWIAQPGQKGVKLDWQATWRNWVRNQKRGAIQHEAHRKTGQAPRNAAERGEAFGAECWGRIRAQREADADVDR